MFNHFTKEKSDFLRKKDKSKKGHIDKDAVKIVNEINSKKDYYTTSSCSGRIVLLEMKSKKKNECNWIFSKHDKVNFKEIKKTLENYNNENNSIKNQIYFKQQPIILHVACRNLDAAEKLLNISRKIFRRAGIIGITNRKVVIEIIGDDRLETIIADKDFVIDNNYLKQLIKYANKNFEENKRKIRILIRLIQNI